MYSEKVTDSQIRPHKKLLGTCPFCRKLMWSTGRDRAVHESECGKKTKQRRELPSVCSSRPQPWSLGDKN